MQCLHLQTAEKILNETCNCSFSNMHTSYLIVWNTTEIFIGFFPGYKSNVECRLLKDKGINQPEMNRVASETSVVHATW